MAVLELSAQACAVLAAKLLGSSVRRPKSCSNPVHRDGATPMAQFFEDDIETRLRAMAPTKEMPRYFLGEHQRTNQLAAVLT